MEQSDVLEILSSSLAELRQEFGVKRMWLFGSMARGDAGTRSDVDVLVEFDRPAGLFELFRLQDRLSGLLGRPVDVGTPGGLKPRIRERVMKECIDVAWTMASAAARHC
jgi:hypothetical protein